MAAPQAGTLSVAMHAAELASLAAHSGEEARAEALIQVARILAATDEKPLIDQIAGELKDLLCGAGPPRLAPPREQPWDAQTGDERMNMTSEYTLQTPTESGRYRRPNRPNAPVGPVMVWKALLVVVICGLGLALVDTSELSAPAELRLAETQMRDGNSERALTLLSGLPSELARDPRVGLLRGQALLARGDTSSAAAAFLAAAASDRNGTGDAWSAARLLENIGQTEAAADAYTYAFAAGLGAEQWPRVSAALRAAGRTGAASRLEAMLPSAAAADQ